MSRFSIKTVGLLAELAALLKVDSQTSDGTVSQLHRVVAEPMLHILEQDPLKKILGEKAETLRSAFANSRRIFCDKDLRSLVEVLKTLEGQSILVNVPKTGLSAKKESNSYRDEQIRRIVLDVMGRMDLEEPTETHVSEKTSLNVGYFTEKYYLGGHDIYWEDILWRIECKLKKELSINIPQNHIQSYLKTHPSDGTVGDMIIHYQNTIRDLT